MAKNSTFPVLGALFLAACSPYAYNQEITSFGGSVDTIASAHQVGEQAIATQIKQDQQAARVTARQRLNLLPGCDSIDPSGSPQSCRTAPS
jgi:hypothetical protein